MGTLNSFDVETLANRMHNAGSKINDALTLQAQWMPTIFGPAKISAGIDTLMNQLISASNDFALGFNTDVTKFVSWTIYYILYYILYKLYMNNNRKVICRLC